MNKTGYKKPTDFKNSFQKNVLMRLDEMIELLKESKKHD